MNNHRPVAETLYRLPNGEHVKDAKQAETVAYNMAAAKLVGDRIEQPASAEKQTAIAAFLIENRDAVRKLVNEDYSVVERLPSPATVPGGEAVYGAKAGRVWGTTPEIPTQDHLRQPPAPPVGNPHGVAAEDIGKGRAPYGGTLADNLKQSKAAAIDEAMARENARAREIMRPADGSEQR